MTRLTRRRFVRNAAVAGAAVGAAALGSAAVAGPAPKGGAALRRAHQDGPVEVVFSHIWGTPPGEAAAANKHPVEQVIEAFNAQSQTTRVVSRTDSTSYYEVLQKAQAELAAGDPPALVITPWANIHFANEGLGITNLEDIAGDEVAAVLGNLREDVLPLVQIEGKTKGLPYAFSCPVFYYNADIFTQAGVDPATALATWDSFLAEMPKVQEALGGNPVVSFATNKDWPAQSIIQSNGGRVLNDENEPVMNGPEAVAAMDTIAGIDRAGLYDRSTTAEMRPSFVAGSTAVFVGSIASLGGLRRDVTFSLATAPFPTFGDKPRRMSSGGSFIGVYARDEGQQQAAWEFLKYAVSEPGYEIWMQTGYLNASIYDIPVLPGQEAAYTQLAEGLTRETAWPGARAAELQAIWGGYVDRIWANDISAEEGCNAAVEEIEALAG